MGPIKLVMTAVQIFLTLGLACGYGSLIRQMASAAITAQTEKPFSAAKFNRRLWTKQPSHKLNKQTHGVSK